MSKHPVHTIIETLTSERIEQALDVSSHSVRAAKTGKSFPASWYRAIFTMCVEAGIPCPPEVFNWRYANKVGNPPPKLQGASQ